MLEELGEQNYGASAALSTKPPRLTGGETDPEKGRHLRAHLPSHHTMSVFPQLPSLGLPQRSRGLKCCAPPLMFQKGNQGPKTAPIKVLSPLWTPGAATWRKNPRTGGVAPDAPWISGEVRPGSIGGVGADIPAAR